MVPTACPLSPSQSLDVGPHKGVQTSLRQSLGTFAARLLLLRREHLGALVQTAHLAGFTPSNMEAGWRKTCLDTMDPTPLLQEIETAAVELKERQERSAAARAQLAGLHDAAEGD